MSAAAEFAYRPTEPAALSAEAPRPAVGEAREIVDMGDLLELRPEFREEREWLAFLEWLKVTHRARGARA